MDLYNKHMSAKVEASLTNRQANMRKFHFMSEEEKIIRNDYMVRMRQERYWLRQAAQRVRWALQRQAIDDTINHARATIERANIMFNK